MMETRIANYADVAKVVKFAKKHHKALEWNVLPFSSQRVKENLCTMIRTEGMDVLIAEKDGEIKALLLAGLDQFFMNKMIYATDVHFVADSGGYALLRKFFSWAREHNAKACIMGIATADPLDRIASFYEASGMVRIGSTWVKWLDENLQEQAA
jgi:hypothetical protein